MCDQQRLSYASNIPMPMGTDPLVLETKIFEVFLPDIGMAVIFIHIALYNGYSILNLSSNRFVATKKIMFKYIDDSLI